MPGTAPVPTMPPYGPYPYAGPPPGYFVPGWGPYRPRTIPHREQDPVPPGYVPDTRAHRGLVVSGVAMFGGAYLISLLMAGTALSENESDLVPLAIPIVGPFVTIESAQVDADNDGGERLALILLIFDGVVQAGGAALFIAGLAAQQRIVVRQDVADEASLVPDVDVGPGRATARWTF